MQNLISAPRPMIVLLGIMVAASFAQTLLFAPSLISLWLPVLEATVAITALCGNRRAGIIFKYFSYLLSVALLLSLFAPRPMTVLLICRRVTFSVLCFVVARYLGKSSEVEKFYASGVSVA